ncbi:hypothetical protein [Coralloluteibacterium stylophorae]|uniref:Secreted protein n=1 Tax=Coralloluteibacterium stylophorae TaxID=1776034 RepID=A0A8J8AXN9_9GAMM|nr:hypothetical protein [Coralloluteibacterium stylophorae]MBS7458681.1 hypothetical protein [Coralloluteibacterium stylophorae]
MNVRSILVAATLAAGAAGAATSGAHAIAPLPATGDYVDASAWLQTDDDVNAWYDIVFGLRDGFDDICGDTFCEGEYSNIESLRFRCSVDAGSGVLGECVWVFAASNEEVHPARGRILVDARSWRCRLPLAAGTTMDELLAALADDPLYAPLPRGAVTIYDGLGDCL